MASEIDEVRYDAAFAKLGEVMRELQTIHAGSYPEDWPENQRFVHAMGSVFGDIIGSTMMALESFGLDQELITELLKMGRHEADELMKQRAAQGG